MTTGEKIKELRKNQNMSQEQLSEVLGLSRQAVSRWETENAIPETAMILKLSELFHVTTDYLLKEEIVDAATQHTEKAAPQSRKYNANLILGICGTAIAMITLFTVLVIAAVNPVMKDGTSGITDPNFWRRNDLIPFALIIIVALLVGIYYFGKYYFKDYQLK